MKVLVVDDQRSARRVLRTMLAQLAETEILEAGTTDDAFRELETSRPDIVLLDVRLSDDPRDRGGLDLLRRMR